MTWDVSSDRLRVLISGAAGGAGLACAAAFAERGAELILCDHDGTALKLASDLFGAFSCFCDVISEASVAIFAAEIQQKFTSIDVLINAAGKRFVRSLGMVTYKAATQIADLLGTLMEGGQCAGCACERCRACWRLPTHRLAIIASGDCSRLLAHPS